MKFSVFALIDSLSDHDNTERTKFKCQKQVTPWILLIILR